MDDFVEWKPERFAYMPPYWRDGMEWGVSPDKPKAQPNVPMWFTDIIYIVPHEAVHGPAEDAEVDPLRAGSEFYLSDAARSLRQYSGKPQTKSRYASLSDLKQALSEHSAEELDKHGITLEPEKDWATELWADLWEVRGSPEDADLVRRGQMSHADREAIELLRSRMPKEASLARLIQEVSDA